MFLFNSCARSNDFLDQDILSMFCSIFKYDHGTNPVRRFLNLSYGSTVFFVNQHVFHSFA